MIYAPKTGDFAGHCYLDTLGTPIASTNGHWLVVSLDGEERGGQSADLLRASQRLIDARCDFDEVALPDPSHARRLLAEAARRAVSGPAREIHSALEPDATLLRIGLESRKAAVLRAEERVATAKAKLDRALATREETGAPRVGRALGITPAREQLAEAEHELREAKKSNAAHCNAVRLGDACFHLAVVRDALRALGAKRGVLQAGPDGYDAGVLITDGGIGLVMPFRP